jgi:hypothetical protein
MTQSADQRLPDCARGPWTYFMQRDSSFPNRIEHHPASESLQTETGVDSWLRGEIHFRTASIKASGRKGS